MPNLSNITIVSHNQTSHSSPELIFPGCESICEIQENLHPWKVTLANVQDVNQWFDNV